MLEACKFSERVQFDAFAFNELGDVQDVINIGGSEGVLAAVRDAPNLSIMNLTLDAIPCLASCKPSFAKPSRNSTSGSPVLHSALTLP